MFRQKKFHFFKFRVILNQNKAKKFKNFLEIKVEFLDKKWRFRTVWYEKLDFRLSICFFLISLPLEFWSHGPLLIHWVGHTITQFGRIWIVFLGCQAFIGVHMSDGFVLIVIHPGLVSAHAVTSHKFDRPVWARCI